VSAMCTMYISQYVAMFKVKYVRYIWCDLYKILSFVVYEDMYLCNMIGLGILYFSQVYEGIILALLASFWKRLVLILCRILRLVLFRIYVYGTTEKISSG
jgi:hypothetical protein